MRLLSIGSIEPIEGFKDRLKLEFDILNEEGFKITLKQIFKGDVLYCYCYVDDEVLLKENHFDELTKIFIDCVANALSDIIINHWEPKLLKRIIKENYFYFNKVEQKRIYEFAQDILNFNVLSGKRDVLYQIKRKAFILHKIKEYLLNNNVIILDGFVNFRLKEYMDQLEESVDKAIDEYLMDKEYREFIKLLRHFVNLQEPKRDLVNVVFQGAEIILLDKNSGFIERIRILT